MILFLAGTRGYTAPEVMAGMQSDERSDIYSVGLLLYELLSGKSLQDPPLSNTACGGTQRIFTRHHRRNYRQGHRYQSNEPLCDAGRVCIRTGQHQRNQSGQNAEKEKETNTDSRSHRCSDCCCRCFA